MPPSTSKLRRTRLLRVGWTGRVTCSRVGGRTAGADCAFEAADWETSTVVSSSRAAALPKRFEPRSEPHFKLTGVPPSPLKIPSRSREE